MGKNLNGKQSGAAVYDQDMRSYYRHRAAEYDQIYLKPERQQALRELEKRVTFLPPGRRVLEIACGTGYWTRILAATVRTLVATDINPEVIEIARTRCRSCSGVTFHITDAFDLPAALGGFDGVFMGFWWSHIPKQDIPPFLEALHTRLEKNARVILMDNLFVAGSSTPIHRTDIRGNTYQLRKLADGSAYEILKNFPEPMEIEEALSTNAASYSYWSNDYYWLAECIYSG